ncbi:hypothetical protein JTB14_026310 [Gonioctena quinquepunctata]|nr:hypothetical protein JTB14_026310 [Gonioctena quinquepunctata]
MRSVHLVIVLFLPLCLTKSADITFKNVTFRGYSVFTEKFKKTIASSHKLKESLPNSVYDKIEFEEQNIPVLYENSLSDLDELDELVIENCGVYEIRPGALKNVPLLRRLSLKGNKLEEIKNGVFDNLPLSTLDLSLNYITIISPTAFDNMRSLLNINLADNQIVAWNPSWFKNSDLLTRISLQNNSIETLPSHAFKNLKSEKKFGSVDLTINLIFSHNKIKKIDQQAFAGLVRINNLWLDNNLIEEFSGNLLKDVQIDDLRLNNNNIECFKGDLNDIFKANTTHIDSNPLECGCLEEIKEWTKKNGKNVEYFYADMECSVIRIRKKMIALKNRLEGIRNDDDDEDIDIKVPALSPVDAPIKK